MGFITIFHRHLGPNIFGTFFRHRGHANPRDCNYSSLRDVLLMVNGWFGARRFGFRKGSPYVSRIVT